MSAEIIQKDDDFLGLDYYFNPEDYVITTLKRAIANDQNIEVSLGEEKIVVVPATGEYLAFVNDEKKFYAAEAKAFKVTVLKQENIDNYFSNALGKNIDELMWKAGFYASNGRLIKGCEREDVVQLKYWPNLTRLPGPANAIRIAALLTRYPTSVTLATRMLKVPMEEMFSFYTAAHCAGWDVLHNRTVEPPKLKPHRDNTMLSKLLAKISSI